MWSATAILKPTDLYHNRGAAARKMLRTTNATFVSDPSRPVLLAPTTTARPQPRHLSAPTLSLVVALADAAAAAVLATVAAAAPPAPSAVGPAPGLSSPVLDHPLLSAIPPAAGRATADALSASALDQAY